MSEKRKGLFLAKLTKILLIILALLVISVISLTYIWKYTRNDEDLPVSTPKPTSQDKPTEPATQNRFTRKNKKTPKVTQKNKKQSEREQRIKPVNYNAFSSEETIDIEPEATSADLTKRITEMVTAGRVDVSRIEAYLKQGVDPNHIIDGESPLFLAASSWRLPILEQLGVIDFAAATENGWTIMHIICENEPKTEEEKGRAGKTLEYLIRNGGDIDALNVMNGYSPLMYAIKLSNFEMSRILLNKGAKADGPIPRGFDVNPLMVAVEYQQSRIIKLLTERGANILAYNKDGVSALQYAAILGYVEELDFLLSLLKYDGLVTNPENIQVPAPAPGEVETEDREIGSTLLHFAVMHNQFKVAEYLILSRKVDLTLTDKKGYTAFEHANYCYQHYSEAAMLDPENNAEDRGIAEQILKLFSSGEEERARYERNIENNLLRHLNEMSRNVRRKKEDEADDKDFEYLRSQNLI